MLIHCISPYCLFSTDSVSASVPLQNGIKGVDGTDDRDELWNPHAKNMDADGNITNDPKIHSSSAPSDVQEGADVPQTSNRDIANEGGSTSVKQRYSTRTDSPDLAPERHLLFACPFFKRDPRLYSNCAQFAVERIRDIKQHVYRNHFQQPRPHHCPQCKLTFESIEDFQEHLVVHPEQVSILNPPLQVQDVFNDQQRRDLLEIRSPPLNIEAQWYRMFNIVCSGSPHPDSPYHHPQVYERTVAQPERLIVNDEEAQSRASLERPSHEQVPLPSFLTAPQFHIDPIDASYIEVLLEPTDSGYGSTYHPELEKTVAEAMQIESVEGDSTRPFDQGSTDYSSASSIRAESNLTRYITSFSEELSTMFPTSLHVADLSWVRSMLPPLLEAFAIKLGYCDPSPFARNLMYLVHRYRQ